MLFLSCEVWGEFLPSRGKISTGGLKITTPENCIFSQFIHLCLKWKEGQKKTTLLSRLITAGLAHDLHMMYLGEAA